MPHFLYDLARLSAFTAQGFHVVIQSKYSSAISDYVWASSGDFFNPPVYKLILWDSPQPLFVKTKLDLSFRGTGTIIDRSLLPATSKAHR